MATRLSLRERLAAYLDRYTIPEPNSGCLLWTGATRGNGYGQITIRIGTRVKKLGANRAAFYVKHGRWPRPNALHHCDTPPCCEPCHLHEGDQSRNAKDRVARGRDRSVTHPELVIRGEQSVLAVLTDELVLRMRTRYAVGDISVDEVALENGVNCSTAYGAISGRSWRHLPVAAPYIGGMAQSARHVEPLPPEATAAPGDRSR